MTHAKLMIPLHPWPVSERMTPRWLLTPLLLAALVAPAARAWADEPRLVRVPLGGAVTMERLLRDGFDVVDVRGQDSATLLEWPQDAAKLARLGVAPTVLDEHPGRTAATLARAELAARGRTGQALGAQPVHRAGKLDAPPFGGGSMGGYWTTAEIKQELDALVAGDTHDVVDDKIDTLGYSIRHRPIWGLQIGKHVTGPDTRPVVFFNALTHAREPGGMQTLFYFVNDILSRYGTDPYATALLDHRRIYIVPLVNPDGYAVNESLYVATSSFGYWRKNVRDNNNDGVFSMANDGVDLNRNYGWQWGYDDIGSSPDPTTETYRGTGPFTEPETQVQKTAIDNLKPVSGLSFHTYADLVLHPWGYNPAVPLPDAAAFHEWNDLLTHDNAYQSGESGPLLYTVNGEFNDWCYGDTVAKPRAYTWTPEIGTQDDGFWPPPSRITPLAAENLRSCYVVTSIAGSFVQADGYAIQEGALNASYGAHLLVHARNVGVATAGPSLAGTCVPLDPGVRMLVSNVSYPTLASRTDGDPTGGSTFEMVVDDTITPGRLERFEIDFTDANGLYARDTLRIPLGTPTVLASDDASSGLGKWTTTTWGIVSNDPAHPSRYFADSPSGNYPAGANEILTLNQALNLSTGAHAYAVFDTRWDFEVDYDAGLIEGSLNGSTWTLLHSTGSTPGSGISNSVQIANQPYFAGTRWNWKTEWADLSPFTGAAGSAARLRFRVRGNGSGQFDGMSMDSLRVLLYDPGAQPALVAVNDAPTAATVELSTALPNPVRSIARFEFALPRASTIRLDVVDLQGRVVRNLAAGPVAAGHYARVWDRSTNAGSRAAPGVYFVRLATGDRAAVTRRFALVD